jgi:hypothetical protein
MCHKKASALNCVAEAERTTNMTNKIAMYAATRSTVHCWSPNIPNKTFRSLGKAIEYARKHADELPAIEVFVHAADQQEQIISGDELACLVKQVCSNP